MSQTPLVSIVLPTFNGSRYIASSIESILTQTYRNLELIVVDGGSTDNTLELVRAFGDSRIRIVPQPANSGRLPGALNTGFAEARGQYFTWAQDDDLYTPDALELLVAELNAHPEVGLVYTGMWRIDSEGNVLSVYDPQPPEAIYRTNPVGHCFLYRRSVAEQAGPYAVGYYMAEDFEYWLRLSRLAPLRAVSGQHYSHRLHGGSLTLRNYGQYWALRIAARARREILKISWANYQRQVAAAYIEEAFAAYANGDFARVRGCALNGLIRNPLWLGNRGLVVIVLRSLWVENWVRKGEGEK